MIGELVQSLGFGQRVTLAAVFVIGVLYLFRARSVSKRAIGMIGTMWIGAISVFLAAAAAIYFGWVDPYPSTFLSDVWAAGRALIEVGIDVLRDLLPKL